MTSREMVSCRKMTGACMDADKSQFRHMRETAEEKSGHLTHRLTQHSTFNTGMIGLAPAPNALKSDMKKPRICPIWGQSDPLWSQTYHPWPSEVK